MNSKQFATIVVITFIVGMIWLGADIIFNTKASIPISDKLQVLLEPVIPNFNTRVLDLISKETLDTADIRVSDSAPVNAEELSAVATPNPAASPEASPVVSPSPQSSVKTPLPSGAQEL